MMLTLASAMSNDPPKCRGVYSTFQINKILFVFLNIIDTVFLYSSHC